METVKRVGLDTNIFLGILLEEKDKLDLSVRGTTQTGAFLCARSLPSNAASGGGFARDRPK